VTASTLASAKRDRLGVADTEIDAWMAPDCLGDHGLGKFHSYDFSTTPSCHRGKRAGATGNVQNTHARSCLNRVTKPKLSFQ